MFKRRIVRVGLVVCVLLAPGVAEVGGQKSGTFSVSADGDTEYR
jgi:hypothetical protein